MFAIGIPSRFTLSDKHEISCRIMDKLWLVEVRDDGVYFCAGRQPQEKS